MSGGEIAVHVARRSAEVLGWTVAGAAAVNAARNIWGDTLAPINLERFRRSGEWAVVTGASEGIGRAFVDELAARGFNVVMMSLPDAALDATHAALARKHPKVQLLKVGIDFAADDFGSVAAKALEGLTVSLLVNNVGINYRYPNWFETAPAAFEAKMLKVNCESITAMTKLVLPGMKKRRAGAVICMSSVTATIPAGLLSTYSATKAFAAQFCRAMAAECRTFGVDFLAVAPNFVATRMSRKRPGLMVSTPAELAVGALRQLGRSSFTPGNATQRAIATAYASLPEPLLQRVVFSANDSVRKLGEKADARRRSAPKPMAGVARASKL